MSGAVFMLRTGTLQVRLFLFLMLMLLILLLISVVNFDIQNGSGERSGS
jgi:hypothetical protein